LRINLTHPRQALAAAALVVAAASAAIPAVGIALAPPSASTVVHVAALGCTRAEVCTTDVANGVIEPYTDVKTSTEDHAIYPIAPATAVGKAAAAAAPAFVCYDSCQRN
jgi:hypothetical protein